MSGTHATRGVTLSTYVAPDEAAELRARAAAADRTIAAEIRRVIRRSLISDTPVHSEGRPATDAPRTKADATAPHAAAA